jgi:hypothetical protein
MEKHSAPRAHPTSGATIQGTAGCPGQTILRAQSTTEKPTCIPAVIAITNSTRSKTDFHHSGCRWSACPAIFCADFHFLVASPTEHSIPAPRPSGSGVHLLALPARHVGDREPLHGRRKIEVILRPQDQL